MYKTDLVANDPGNFEMFDFFEMTPDLVCIAGEEGFFKKVNPAVIEKLGYTKEELFARPITSFIHPDDREITGKQRAELLQGRPLLNFQNRYIAKQGDIIWLEWTSIYVPDKEVVFAIAKDITARKQIEEEIEEKYKKFKSLATHFKANLEEEKKYLAVELHEELAQLASVVKMDIEHIRASEPGMSVSSKAWMEHAIVISDLLINTIRRISYSISPGMLEDIGLDATLKWHCREFSILNGIPCEFESAYNEDDLTQEIKTDFFRICQEALTNIMYHAEASSVKVAIEKKGEKICLSIADDGKGFEVEGHKQYPGLFAMRERAASVNGRLMIESKPGTGTRVSVIVEKPGALH